MEDITADVVLIQEHKETEEGLRGARAEARRLGWTADLAAAGKGEAGPAGGVGCLSRKGVPVKQLPGKATPHADRWRAYMVAGRKREVLVVSVYGYSSEGSGPRNRALISELVEWAAGHKGLPVAYGGTGT